MEEAPRIGVDELKQRMEAGEELFILDMRRGSWWRSDVKIKGAVRMEREEVLEPDGKLPHESLIVTYCT